MDGVSTLVSAWIVGMTFLVMLNIFCNIVGMIFTTVRKL